MKIISWNVNGIRSVYKKDFFSWFKNINADIICLQELKAQENQIPEELLQLKNYSLYLNIAKKKGYSGVAIYSKIKPLKIKYKLGLKKFDDEGRFIQLEFKNFILIGIYVPHGGRAKENLAYKLEFYDFFIKYVSKIKNKKIILLGDFNIAHKEIDLARPKQNQNNIMFTPKERAQIDKLIKIGFTDTFRKLNTGEGNYTWWPYFASARERNLGWRIDYIFISSSIENKLKKAEIFDKIFGSDHCPVAIEIEIK